MSYLLQVAYIMYMAYVSENGVSKALRCTQVLYNNSAETLAEMTQDELQELFVSAPTVESYLDPGTTVIDAVMKAGCFNREGEMFSQFHINTHNIYVTFSHCVR